MTPLTDRQQKILDMIQDHIDRLGYPPTIREIGRAVGISSTSVVNYHLNKLKKAGLIQRDGQVSRGLAIPDLVTVRIGEEVLVAIDGEEFRAVLVGPVAKAA